MFGSAHTYFAGSPVVIDISGLEWGSPVTSPFTIVRVEVIRDDNTFGDFRCDTGGQTSTSFDISSALRSIWSDYDFSKEVAAAQAAVGDVSGNGHTATVDGVDFIEQGVRRYRDYSLRVYTEYLDSVDREYTTTAYGPFSGGRCALGRLTEWERSIVANKADADASYWEHSNARNGDASTKPASSPERVGSASITSWTDVNEGGTKSVFYPSSAKGTPDSWNAHAPLVLRDAIPYQDFLFINRRGAVETCSGQMLESMGIDVTTQQYSLAERPAFQPSRSLDAVSSGGRRSWSMSSGYQTREWAEWWTMEFLMARKWWMLYQGRYVPVVVNPGKDSTLIYDRTKQQMPHVDFTVTLALEG